MHAAVNGRGLHCASSAPLETTQTDARLAIAAIKRGALPCDARREVERNLKTRATTFWAWRHASAQSASLRRLLQSKYLSAVRCGLLAFKAHMLVSRRHRVVFRVQFDIWRAATSYSRRQRQRLYVFACSRKERKTKACLTRWFNTCKYQQDLRIHAEAMHSRAIMKTSFRFWRLLAAQIIRKRLSENNVACVVRDRHRLAVMKRTFYDWIDAVEAIGKERAKAHWRLEQPSAPTLLSKVTG